MPALKNTQVESKNKPQEKGLILQLQIYAHQGSEYQRIPPYQGQFVVVRCGDHQYTKDKGHSKIEKNLLPQDQYYDKRTVKSSSQMAKYYRSNTIHPTECRKMFDCHPSKEYDRIQTCHQEHSVMSSVKHNVAGHQHDPT